MVLPLLDRPGLVDSLHGRPYLSEEWMSRHREGEEGGTVFGCKMNLKKEVKKDIKLHLIIIRKGRKGLL